MTETIFNKTLGTIVNITFFICKVWGGGEMNIQVKVNASKTQNLFFYCNQQM